MQQVTPAAGLRNARVTPGAQTVDVPHSSPHRPTPRKSTMNSTLPPEAWRSEAFAEDLFDDTTDAPGRTERGGATLLVLWGVLPVVVAAAGAAVMAWSGA
jgi:hypothetical protein